MSSDRRPRKLQKLYEMFADGEELPVEHVYEAYFGREPDAPIKRLQQRLGSTVTRFNRLGGPRIVPGSEKYTYTLVEG